jgi:polysaccharide biosynthesis protein PslG
VSKTTWTTARSLFGPRATRRIVAGAAATLAGMSILGAGAAASADGATPAAQPAATTATTGYASVGAQFHGMWSIYSDAQRAAVLDKLKAAGSRSVRLDVSWAMLQPTGPNSYDTWGVGFVDRVINMASSRGMKPLVTLWLTPGWANRYQGERVLPDNPADYARVAKWAAQRWHGKVLGWEVWNEQNSEHFLVGADPVAYTRVLRAAYPAFKAGSATTPVIFGGVQYNDTDWIRRAYDAGAKGAFDVMATHPYMGVANAAPGTPDDGTMWTLTHATTVHQLMVARGDGAKKIWFTELGWSTHANPAGTPNWNLGVTEATQAAFLTQTVNLVRQQMPYVTRMYWYNERDLGGSDAQLGNFGLLRTDLSAKPIMSALAAANGGTATARAGTTPVVTDAVRLTDAAPIRPTRGQDTTGPVAPSWLLRAPVPAAASTPTSSQVNVASTGLRKG